MAAEEKINVPALAEPCPSPASPIIAPPSLADHANPVIHTLRIPAKCRRGASKGNLATCSTCFVQVRIRLGCLHAVKPEDGGADYIDIRAKTGPSHHDKPRLRETPTLAYLC
ncbi:MAG TPA: hypothetical protein VNN75_08765 [Stellaceae bacterium]|nr:hypothetical protein [Stellaceae bacterium]